MPRFKPILLELLLCIVSIASWANQCDASTDLKLNEAHEIPHKLVCYYTSWAADRPVPWSYVSSD